MADCGEICFHWLNKLVRVIIVTSLIKGGWLAVCVTELEYKYFITWYFSLCVFLTDWKQVKYLLLIELAIIMTCELSR